ncbi:hypothetical protein NDU88_003845 [Pleurodeles waltl]|uniref:CTCK domain-containing protein n=1 Tax=Pleurodeles waltl TaxID=8319 RepID=A0AAV7TPJ4_PLEWA|nr:hypothetical protein NDU88_003845 [Pleurodeles waltl]
MKAAVLTVLLFVTYVKCLVDVPAELAEPADLAVGVSRECFKQIRTVFVKKGACSGYVPVASCSGTCQSTVSYSLQPFTANRRCYCCTETRIVAKAVKLPCKLGGFYIYKYYTIGDCTCSSTKCDILSSNLPALPALETAEVSEATSAA